MLKKVLIGLLVLLVVIQFIRPARNISSSNQPNDIAAHYPVPQNVQQTLKKACYDCHSNNTRYPWYANIQPVAWWLQDHINEGKKELNFSEFASYAPKKQARKLKKVASEVKEGEMPLNSYLWIHTDAVLNADEKEALINWATSLQHQIEQANNLNAEIK
jgi:hypothetical protein